MLAVIIDQLSKGYARSLLAEGVQFHIAGGLIRFEYVENFAGFLGFLAAIPEPFRAFLLTAGVGMLLVISALIVFRGNMLATDQLLAASLVLAGGTGNLIDRLFNNGGVIDFLVLSIGPLSTGIFNIADVYILVCGFYLGYSLARSLPSA